MTSPLVSIVIVNFNRLSDLKETLKRVKDIRYEHLEIIIVDSGSNDGSADYLRSLDRAAYHTILLPENKGSAYGHNQGMKAARGTFVVTIDDDCYLHPDVVTQAVAVFERNPGLAAIGFGFVNPLTDFNEVDYQGSVTCPFDDPRYQNSYDTLVYTSAAAFRKEALEKVEYIDETWFYVTEDIELNFNLIAHGYNTVTIPELTAYHKSAPSNRNFDQITYNGVQGTIWLALKYYPMPVALARLFRLLYLSILFSILNRKTVYLKAVIGSLSKAPRMLMNKVRLTSPLDRQIALPDYLLFSR